MDVGQGDGIYLSTGKVYPLSRSGRKNILIDSGSSSNRNAGKYVTVNFLKSKAVGRLDAIFVTHADADHTNAVLYLLTESDIRVDVLYLPCLAKDDENYDELREAAIKHDTEVGYLKAGDVLLLGKARLFCAAPSQNDGTSDLNDQSTVLVYDEGMFRALFMGDASQEVERRICDKYQLDNVTILKCGHHGSNTASGEELIDETNPRYAILSYGEGNRYGHPHQETLDTLAEHGITALHTAESGAISVYTDGRKIKIAEYDTIYHDEDT